MHPDKINTPASKPEPSHSINPKDKDEKWGIDMAKHVWDKWTSYNVRSFQKGQDRYTLNELYSIGKQPNDIYKPWFKTEEDENTSFMNLDFTPIPVIPKFKRITTNRIEKIDFEIEAQAIDSYALQDRDNYESEEWARIKMREILSEVGGNPALMDTDELDQPKNIEELGIKMEFGYKHNMAIDIEKRVSAVFEDDRVKQDVLPRCRDSFWNKGVAGVRVITDPSNGRVRLRPVDVSRFICSYTEDPLFRDIQWAGEVILVTISEIRKRNPNITEQQLENLAGKNAGIYGNPKHFNKRSIGAYSYDDCLIPVLDLEFSTLNVYKYEKRVNKIGNPVVGKTDPKENKKDRTYHEDSGIYWYQIKWILDTEYAYDYQMCHDQAVKNNKLWDSQCSYIMRAIDMQRFETNPIVEQIIPFADQIVLAYLKLQAVIASARPKGIAIEIGALENLPLGKGGANLKPLTVLDLYNQTGSLIFRRIDPSGNISQALPITELEGGMGSQAAELFAVIQQNFQMIRDTLGFNDVTDGSTPDPKMLNGVAAMSAEATNNALHQLISAERDLIERVADMVAMKVHDSINLRGDSYYKDILGPRVLKSIKENSHAIHRVYGIHLRYNADKTEKAKLEMRIERALQLGPDQGGISLADAYAIEHCSNLKQAEMLLSYRVKKNTEEAQKRAMQMQEKNAQVQIQSSQIAEEEKRKTLQAEGQIKMQTIQLEKDLELRNKTEEYKMKFQQDFGTKEGKKEVEGVKNEGLKEVAKIKTDGKKETVSI